MKTEEGLKLLEEAYLEYETISRMSRGAKGKTLQSNERKMSFIRNRVNGILRTCPQLEDYIDYKDVFFSSVFFESDLQGLIKNIKQDLTNSTTSPL